METRRVTGSPADIKRSSLRAAVWIEEWRIRERVISLLPPDLFTARKSCHIMSDFISFLLYNCVGTATKSLLGGKKEKRESDGASSLFQSAEQILIHSKIRIIRFSTFRVKRADRDRQTNTQSNPQRRCFRTASLHVCTLLKTMVLQGFFSKSNMNYLLLFSL